ncbi:MAG: hypothetical protein NT083_15840 [Rhodocyclales bacterium]|jgi:uncharacterized membrane protein YtjA (UPF0391 family)|nr:hypothetical protein [Rhodocyclales bacterium]
MKIIFLAVNLIYGIPGLVLGIAASSGVAQNPVAAVLGFTVAGLATVCLWLAKESLANDLQSASHMA